MSQHDYDIADGSGAAVRTDINNVLDAIVSQNSGSTAPTPTFSYQWWADTSSGKLKQRTGANNAWNVIGDLDANNLGQPNFTISSSAATGGSNGDVWFEY